MVSTRVCGTLSSGSNPDSHTILQNLQTAKFADFVFKIVVAIGI